MSAREEFLEQMTKSGRPSIKQWVRGFIEQSAAKRGGCLTLGVIAASALVQIASYQQSEAIESSKHRVMQDGSRRKQSLEALKALDSRTAISQIIPIVIADARRPLSRKDNAEKLAADLQFISKALALDENDIAATQVQEIAVNLNPSRVDYQALLADSASRAGRASQAKKLYSAIPITGDADPIFIKMLTQYKVRSGDPNGARLLAERFAQREDLKSDGWFQAIRARAWLRSGVPNRAASLLHAAADLVDNDYCRHIWESTSNFLSGNVLEATKHLTEAGKVLPDDPLWHTDLATVLAGHDITESRVHLLQALMCKRVCSRAFLSNAHYLQTHGQYDAVKNCLDYYSKLRPTSAELRFARARLAKAEGKFKAAIAEFQDGLKLNPYAPQAFIEEAACYQELKQPEQAKLALKTLTENCPNFLQGWLKHGDALKQSGDSEAARAAYLSGLKLVPDIIEFENIVFKNDVGALHARMAAIYYCAGDRSKALDEATKYNHFKLVLDLPAALKMLNLRPGRLNEKTTLKTETQVRDCVLLADAFFDGRDFKNAIVEYRKAIAIDGDNADLHSYLLNSLTEDGDWSAAAGEDFHLSDSLMKKMPEKIGNFLHHDSKAPTEAAPQM